MRITQKNINGIHMTSAESAVGDINLSYAKNCTIQGITPGFAIKYVARGAEEYQIGEESIAIDSGQFFFLRNDIPFHVFNPKGAKLTKGCCMNFRLEAMPELSNLFSNDLLFYLPFSASASSDLGKKLQQISNDSGLGELKENHFDLIQSDIRLFAKEVHQFQERLHPHSKNKKTQKAILMALYFARDFVNRHFDKNISLDDLARKSGISKYYFLRLFKACFGISPLKLQHELRMKSALKKMSLQNQNLSEIAYSLGYRDLASFSKKFKTYFGYPPSKYSEVV